MRGQYKLQRIGKWGYSINKQNKKIEAGKTDSMEGVRSGRWLFYNKRGELIQMVDYNWPEK